MNAIARRVFTLVELLVVIAILSFLAMLLLPALKKGVERSRRIVCMNNEKQLYLSAVTYANDNYDQLPYSVFTTGMYLAPNGGYQQHNTLGIESFADILWLRDYVGLPMRQIVGYFVLSNPRPNAVLFCPSYKGGWISPGFYQTGNLPYAPWGGYRLSAFGRFTPQHAPAGLALRGVPKLTRMGGQSYPYLFFQEWGTWGAGDQPRGGSHDSAGGHMTSETGAVKWVEVVNGVNWIENGYDGSYPSDYYSVHVANSNGLTFNLIRPPIPNFYSGTTNWEAPAELPLRLQIAGY